jgi:hypothetical protein
MKKLLALTAAVALASITSAAFAADNVTIMITKSSDTMAKVTPATSKGTSSVVPITFASGTSWSDVKDSYSVSPDTASKLAEKKECITVASDGGISYSPRKSKK